VKKPLIIGHRFGNDLSLLAAAAEAGADYVEADVWLRKGRLEVRHARTLGPVPVLWDRWWIRRRPEKQLELGEVLRALPAGMGIMIDVKGSARGMPAALLAALERDGGDHPVMISSRFWDHLRSLRAYPNIMLFHSVGRPWELWKVRPRLKERENDAICISYRMLSAERTRALREDVRWVSTWGINDEERLARVLEWGLDVVITDEVSIMRRIRELSSD
jgi:glycerophosphoryl diester phosphodiesterase